MNKIKIFCQKQNYDKTLTNWDTRQGVPPLRDSTFWVFVMPVLNVLSMVFPYLTLCETKVKCSRCCPCPLRHRFAMPPLPKWEALAVREVSGVTLYALLPQKEPSGVTRRLSALAVRQKSRGILCYAKLSPPFRAISLAKNFNLWYTVKKT